jgi:hypothetical protein
LEGISTIYKVVEGDAAVLYKHELANLVEGGNKFLNAKRDWK